MATALGQTRAPASGTGHGPQAMCQPLAPASGTRQGSQAMCQNSDPFQWAGSIGDVSTQAMKSTSEVNIVSLSGNTAVSSSTSTSAASTMQSQSSMALPSTGMDMQWRDPTAQNDLASGPPYMWADDLYVMQPQQFVPMGQQVFATAPVQASQPFVQQPAASASAPGQQAQDAVIIGVSHVADGVVHGSTATTHGFRSGRARNSKNEMSTGSSYSNATA